MLLRPPLPPSPPPTRGNGAKNLVRKRKKKEPKTQIVGPGGFGKSIHLVGLSQGGAFVQKLELALSRAIRAIRADIGYRTPR